MIQVDKSSRTEIEACCATWGRDSLLVQGAGGNVSWKDGDVLWIKASGKWLAEAQREDIFVGVELPPLLQAFATQDFGVAPHVVGTSTLRPSIETLLHALMPHRLVVHLHPVEVLAYLVRADGREQVQQRLGDRLAFAWVGYHKPGAELAAAVSAALAGRPDVDVVFLANHGVVIGGDSIAALSDRLDRLLALLQVDLSVSSRSDASESASVAGVSTSSVPAPLPGYVAVELPHLNALATDPLLLARVRDSWALYPDHVVFLGAHSRVVAAASLTAEDEADLLFVEGAGVYSAEPLSKARLAQLQCFYDVVVRQPAGERLRVLDEPAIGELLNWDAEKYRQCMKT